MMQGYKSVGQKEEPTHRFLRLIDQNHNQFDSICISEDEPFTLETFQDLIEAHYAEGKSFIIARVDSESMTQSSSRQPQPSPSGLSPGSNPSFHLPSAHSSKPSLSQTVSKGNVGKRFYYSANHLNKVLFRQYGDNGEYLFRLYALNPLTNTPIFGDVHYYLVVEDWDQADDETSSLMFKERLELQKNARNHLKNMTLKPPSKSPGKKSKSFDALMRNSIGIKEEDIQIAEITGPCGISFAGNFNKSKSDQPLSFQTNSIQENQPSTSAAQTLSLVNFESTFRYGNDIPMHNVHRNAVVSQTSIPQPNESTTSLPVPEQQPHSSSKWQQDYSVPKLGNSDVSRSSMGKWRSSSRFQQEEQTIVDLTRLQSGKLKNLQEVTGTQKQLFINNDYWRMKLRDKSKPQEHTFYSSPALTQSIINDSSEPPLAISKMALKDHPAKTVPLRELQGGNHSFVQLSEGSADSLSHLFMPAFSGNNENAIKERPSQSLTEVTSGKTDTAIAITIRSMNASQAQDPNYAIEPNSHHWLPHDSESDTSSRDMSKVQTLQSVFKFQSFKAIYIGSDDDYLTSQETRAIFARNTLSEESPDLFVIPKDVLLSQGILLEDLVEVSYSHVSLRELGSMMDQSAVLPNIVAPPSSRHGSSSLLRGAYGSQYSQFRGEDVIHEEEESNSFISPPEDIPDISGEYPEVILPGVDAPVAKPSEGVFSILCKPPPRPCERKKLKEAYHAFLKRHSVGITFFIYFLLLVVILSIALVVKLLVFLIPLIVLTVALPIGVQCSRMAASHRGREDKVLEDPSLNGEFVDGRVLETQVVLDY